MRLSRSKYLGLALATLGLIFVLMAYFVYARGNIVNNQEVVKTDKPSEAIPSAAARMLSKGSSDTTASFKGWAQTQLVFSTVRDASKELSFELKSPKSPAAGTIDRIYINKKAPNEIRLIWVYFADPATAAPSESEIPAKGIRNYVYEEAEKPDFDNYVEQVNKNRQLGINKSDKDVLIVDINGNQGVGIEPGYNAINGKEAPRGGFVTWWEGGIRYTIYGMAGPEGTTLDALLEIARSMQ